MLSIYSRYESIYGIDTAILNLCQDNLLCLKKCICVHVATEITFSYDLSDSLKPVIIIYYYQICINSTIIESIEASQTSPPVKYDYPCGMNQFLINRMIHIGLLKLSSINFKNIYEQLSYCINT